MKNVKIILLVSFILGLVLFQVKFVAENDNFNIKAAFSTLNANAEASQAGNYRPHSTTVHCGYNYYDGTRYYDCMGDLLGVKAYINNVLQYPVYYGEYCYALGYNESKPITGTKISCEAGKFFCMPETRCH